LIRPRTRSGGIVGIHRRAGRERAEGDIALAEEIVEGREHIATGLIESSDTFGNLVLWRV